MEDMHAGTIQPGDYWLQTHLLCYVTWARNNNSLLIVTFHEDEGSANNHISTLLIGATVKPGKYGQNLNHYNVLRTIEDKYKLPHLENAATAKPLTEVWK
jgi:phosphatidylinositol-3-phosphatase